MIKVDKKLKDLLMAKSHNNVVAVATDKIKGYSIYTYGRLENSFTICLPKKLKKGELMPCFISHTDTVSQNKPTRFELVNGVLSNPDGVLGADDRAGVYILSEMMKQQIRGIYIFTAGEEIGGWGAKACIRHDHFQEILPNISCFIELDRQDNKDIALYGYDNTNLCAIFEKFGYKQSWGSYTDAVEFSEDTGLACINISVGYKNQHTAKECLVLKDMEATLNIMINHLPKELYTTKYEADITLELSNYSYCEYYEETTITSNPVVCDICREHEKLYFFEDMFLCEYCLNIEESEIIYE